jgi:hypothetical protein
MIQLINDNLAARPIGDSIANKLQARKRAGGLN